jgi:hypothetical protein
MHEINRYTKKNVSWFLLPLHEVDIDIIINKFKQQSLRVLVQCNQKYHSFLLAAKYQRIPVKLIIENFIK